MKRRALRGALFSALSSWFLGSVSQAVLSYQLFDKTYAAQARIPEKLLWRNGEKRRG